MKQWNREDSSHRAKPNQERFAADPVRQRAINRLETNCENKRSCAYEGSLVIAQTNRQLQELLHVCCVRIESRRASRREPYNNQNLPWISEESLKRAFMSYRLSCFDERIRFMQTTPHLEGNDREHRADDEWDAPAPGSHLICRKKYLL